MVFAYGFIAMLSLIGAASVVGAISPANTCARRCLRCRAPSA